MDPIFALAEFFKIPLTILGCSWWAVYLALKKVLMGFIALHLWMFSLELRKPYPRIPYAQEELQEILFGEDY
ncbi:hypothetical protein [Butyrivibrio sp. WCD2001]|uniref:hypothetical protein n=1 Tax=Butyrivibrio sp. WCD2001 TaxID=1280681 RepID=UPI0003F6500F|nr:hypothetical protein [Butyrivibrio sp. WCD2001]